MQLILQPITEQDCEPVSPKCAQARDFAAAIHIIRTRKGCELRSLSFSFAS